ncbi:type IV secretion system DNA-binding domain-containing protein [Mucilaginibacter rubeus]|uniref:Type IV secretion system DNA-binding domain-containing protein n=1 Tax=Mucilaginibacter rubeus TaxID=2027860 RepID=A0AAE6MIM4_9SPHI|nr:MULTISPECIES: type IV secretion system DNA-binding domain-containing protein [Mucilaginibacter]QEM04955.1 type IV secretion system DNA-binding domain-containing protein [Mucilaginibacter rubeus]QEM17549.1 type IV secretion system DNA-binding domain-containing protein [Mucilaginibacter gossypii]QTE45930.1 type IV secretion system DNA-binding domain-containing protein [Mucilaginibacter rubeus]QTE52527.1 type IV secretion system DNA-binding domain-containing protein [Mucilaginibacter rubeus]QT
MEETHEQHKLHGFMQCLIYLSIALEAAIFVYKQAPFWGFFYGPIEKLSHVFIYQHLLYSKLATLLLICLVSIGTLAKKKQELDPKKHILYPLTLGLILFFGSAFLYGRDSGLAFVFTSWYNLGYMLCSLFGAIMLSVSMDNVSKMIRSGLGKDIWNVEGESFMQPVKAVVTAYSVNIPMQFYYKGKVRAGYINIVNPFRGTILIGTPGSGKSFGIVNPFIRQMIAKEFCCCVYDYKYPDLGKIAYYHYLLAKQQGKCVGFDFHVINLNDVERSRRTNPWRADYLRSLADASEGAEGLVEAMKKGDKSGGSDQFFTQSAINFLAACIYFFSKYEGGKYSSFPHVLSFLNHSYEDIFNTLFSEPELVSLLSPFKSAYVTKAFPQLEGQIGTLKIFISRLATKETFWVFSGDDFNLKISDKATPAMVVLANDPNTQNINSACYSVVMNRLTKLINSKGNLPSALIIDEIPTLYTYKIENLLAVARSNKVAILMGLQELPQFNQHYGKDTAATITSVVGNVLAGSVRNKETLDWLERLFGKNKQIGESLSIDRNKTSTSLQEKLEPLIPAGKMASLNTGEMVGLIAADVQETYTGRFETSAINCKVNLSKKELEAEEAGYRDLPVYYDFNGRKEEILRGNFLRINSEVEAVVAAFRKPIPQVQVLPKAKMSKSN